MILSQNKQALNRKPQSQACEKGSSSARTLIEGIGVELTDQRQSIVQDKLGPAANGQIQLVTLLFGLVLGASKTPAKKIRGPVYHPSNHPTRSPKFDMHFSAVIRKKSSSLPA